MNTPCWIVLVIFYVINLHTVANHSDDNHYHTAVNFINCKRASLKLHVPLATKCLHQTVMKPILPGEEVTQTTLYEILRKLFAVYSPTSII